MERHDGLIEVGFETVTVTVKNFKTEAIIFNKKYRGNITSLSEEAIIKKIADLISPLLPNVHIETFTVC